jgi:DNA replication licensing factor MCM2
MIKQFYGKLREESKNTGGMNVAVRHIESIIRVATAHAKIYLRSEVWKEDIEVGIRCILDSFIQTQKHSVSKSIRKKFSSYLG